jgi:integrase
MRRGEVLALRWAHIDLDAGVARVVASLQLMAGELRLMEPKTDRARRTVALPPITVEILRRHRKEQAERRLLAGEAWQDVDFVTDQGDGGPLSPDAVSRAFYRLVRALGLPGLRLHDLRHAYATTLLAAGVHPKIASEALGHSSVAFTMDVYSHVLPTMQGEGQGDPGGTRGASGSERMREAGEECCNVAGPCYVGCERCPWVGERGLGPLTPAGLADPGPLV